jgi:hypothetical protein
VLHIARENEAAGTLGKLALRTLVRENVALSRALKFDLSSCRKFKALRSRFFSLQFHVFLKFP